MALENKWMGSKGEFLETTYARAWREQGNR